MIPITYTKGDATSPRGSGVKIIAHICNDQGGWGKGGDAALKPKAFDEKGSGNAGGGGGRRGIVRWGLGQ